MYISIHSGTWFPPDMTLQAKEFNLCFIRVENWAVMCLLPRSGFCLTSLPYRPDYWDAAKMVVLLEASPLYTCQSDDWVLGQPHLLRSTVQSAPGRALLNISTFVNSSNFPRSIVPAFMAFIHSPHSHSICHTL